MPILTHFGMPRAAVPTRIATLTGAATLTVVIALSGCQQSETKADSTTTEAASNDAALTAQQREASKKLTDGMDRKQRKFADSSFTSDDLPLLAALAEKSDDAVVVEAAFAALTQLADSKQPFSNDLVSVVARGLQHADKSVAVSALRWCQKSPPDEELVALLVRAGAVEHFADDAERFELIRTAQVLSEATDPEVPAPEAIRPLLFDSLKAKKPHVVIQALTALGGPDWTQPNRKPLPEDQRATLVDEVLPLLTSDKPSIRGMTAEFLGRVGPGNEAAEEALIEALNDEAPFVRASAAKALGVLKTKQAVHGLVSLLDDEAPSTLQVKGVEVVGKSSRRKAYKPAPKGFVVEAAVIALHRISRRGFKRAAHVPNDPLRALKLDAKAARAWYQKAKADLPPAPTPSPKPSNQPSKQPSKQPSQTASATSAANKPASAKPAPAKPAPAKPLTQPASAKAK